MGLKGAPNRQRCAGLLAEERQPIVLRAEGPWHPFDLTERSVKPALGLFKRPAPVALGQQDEFAEGPLTNRWWVDICSIRKGHLKMVGDCASLFCL